MRDCSHLPRIDLRFIQFLGLDTQTTASTFYVQTSRALSLRGNPTPRSETLKQSRLKQLAPGLNRQICWLPFHSLK